MSARVRRIGNSLGLVIPKDEAARQGLVEGDIVSLEVVKKTNLGDLFGAFKFSKTAQELKDEARKGWGE